VAVAIKRLHTHLAAPAPPEIHSFSERSLRVLLSCGEEEAQTSRWRELVQ